jgi:hypothetical protein
VSGGKNLNIYEETNTRVTPNFPSGEGVTWTALTIFRDSFQEEIKSGLPCRLITK